MNFGQGKSTLISVWASFLHLEDDDVSAPNFFGHKKKFLVPNAINFSALSRPVSTNQMINYPLKLVE